jgi:hypothetical protein
MNVFKSVDETNSFMLTNIDYEMLAIINSSMKKKLSEINSRIVQMEQFKLEPTTKAMIQQLKDEISYLRNVKSEIESVLHKFHSALTSI